MTYGDLRKIAETVEGADDIDIVSLFMRPGSFYMECELKSIVLIKSSQPGDKFGKPIFGIHIGPSLNGSMADPFT